MLEALNDNGRMLTRLSALVIWALVAASAVFWGLRLSVSAPQAPQHAIPVGETAALRGDMARLLGVTPVSTVAAVAAPEAASRFKLLGVMAPKPGKASAPSQQGVALIAVDGKPPKAFAVGSRLDGDLVLRSVSLRTASIAAAPGQAGFSLELPLLPPPNTGTLPALSLNPTTQAPPPVSAPVLPPATVGQPVPPAPPRVPGAAPQREPNAMAQ